MIEWREEQGLMERVRSSEWTKLAAHVLLRNATETS